MTYRDRYNSLIGKLSKKYSSVLTDKDIADHNKTLRAALKDLDVLYWDIRTHVDMVTTLKRVCQEEDGNFKGRRLKYIERGIKNDLDAIFPSEALTPKIGFDNSRNNPKVSLKLLDRFNNERNPENFCSGLMKQLISFAASFCICSLLGCKILFIDEAFGAASPMNKRKIASILNNAVVNGFQIILISQGSELYDELTRHQINLGLTEDGKAILLGEEDISYDE